MNSFLTGLLHPLAVPTHVLALIAAGLLVGQQGGGRMPWLLALFAAGVAAGLTALAFAARQWSAADTLLVTAAVSGALVAFARPLPVLACATLATATGIALGLDSPPRAISLNVAFLTLIGTGLGATLALAVVATATRILTRAWQKIGVRILGSWIAASAVLVLALQLARGRLF